ncbi:MAG: ABC-type transport auxiliary lipoprotein family protein [Gammaproteobacteria bacterium]
MKRTTVVLALLLLSACSPFTSSERPPDTYRLHGAGLELRGTFAPPGSMVVAVPSMSGVLATDRIVLFLGPHTVTEYAGVRWAEPLDELVHRALIEGLEQELGVSVDPALLRSASYELRVAVRDFQATYPEGAVPERPPELAVTLAVVLVERRSGQVVAQGRATRRDTARSNNIGAVTAGLNRLLLEAFADSLAALAEAE